MAIQDKYETLAPSDAEGARYRHRMLGRDVDIHRLPFGQLRKSQQNRLLATLSRMAALDHPSIPHVIDVVKQQNEYLLVLESAASADRSLESEDDLLKGISQYSQVIDALSHASRHGLAHGDIREASLRTNPQGNTQLIGIGLSQCRISADLDDLLSHDLNQLARLLIGYLNNWAHSEDVEAADRLEGLKQLVHRHLGDGDIDLLNDAVKSWLQAEFAEREAKKLSFDSAEDGEATPSSRTPMIAVCTAGFCLMLTGLLVFAARPRATTQETQLAVAPMKTRSATVQPSPLQGVGILNNPNQKSDAVDDASTALRSEQPLPKTNPVGVVGTDDSKPTNLEKNNPGTTDPTKANGDGPHSDSPPPTQPARMNPFADAERVVGLPSRNETDARILLTTTLVDGDPVTVRLLGGIGAFRKGDFVLELIEDRRWQIYFQQRGENTKIADMSLDAGRLAFSWQPVARDLLAADHLANVIIELSSRAWKHGLALREPVRQQAIDVDLDRKKPYDIDIDSPPLIDDVFVEFITQEGSLAVALPANSVSAANGKLKIGLDAGKQSKVVVQIEVLRSLRKLRITGLGRLTKDSRWAPISPGAEKQLQQELHAGSLALTQLRASVSKLRADRKKIANAKIRQLADRQEALLAFAESLSAAEQTKINLRVTRHVDEYQVSLVEFGD